MSDLKDIIAAEEAKRAELMGTGYTKKDFEVHRKNYLVEAGAGAGKTFIMVQRIVNQLVAGVYEPEDVVAITFTNKSTLELRERLDEQLADRRKKLLEKESLAEEEMQTLERLEYLIQESGRMQVSTIHSFCRTMLTSMPFSSPLGLDMEMLEDESDKAREFLHLKLQQTPALFQKARDMHYSPRLLERAFIERCANNEVDVVYCDDPQKIAQWEIEVKKAAIDLKEALAETTIRDPKIRRDILQILDMDSEELKQDSKKLNGLIWTALSQQYLPTEYGSSPPSSFARSKAGKPLHGVWSGKKRTALCKTAGQLLHSYVMCDLVPLLEEFRREKTRLHLATFNDLLLRARDMLRDDQQARAYFHQRYKVLYVDEMQDTDPVQAELLFYLTTDEKDFDGANWQNCKPVPGSLFLVGDPKQAIYRFRGADIDVYNTLLRLFRGDEEGSVGEKATLRFNFRSSSEICALTDKIFTPDPNAAPAPPHHFVGGKYHAEYVSMIARNGDCPRARMVQYCPGASPRTNDPVHVAAFIRTMIDHRLQVGIHNPKFKKEPHAAQASDFLILTFGKDNIANYSRALNDLDIPVQVTGEKSFQDTPPIRLAVLHLRSLLSLRNDPMLIRVLMDCYGIEIETIRVFLQRTETYSLTGVVKTEKLQAINRALKEETPPDVELLELCTALEEIAELRTAAKNLPAMAVIERLLGGGYGVWKDISGHSLKVRQQVYSEVQQFLNLVRKSRERSFPALAAYAIECAEKEYEQELDLKPTPNAVRIMNLHKAKGLEGEIVILAHSSHSSHVPERQVVRCGNKAEEHVALSYKAAHEHAHKRQVAFPEHWEKTCEEETQHLEAEYARLLYVAATRAKTMLVAFERDSTDRYQKNPSYWEPLLTEMKVADPNDPEFGKAFLALRTGQVVPAKQVNGNTGTDAADDKDNNDAIFAFQPDALENQLRTDAAALAVNSVYAISPSALEKDARGQVNRKDEEEQEVTDLTAVPADQPTADDESVAAAVPTPIHTGPFGPDWGTMVHRVMELAIREGRYTAAALETAARQAVSEALDGGLDPEKLWMLGLAKDVSGDVVMDTLAPQIVKASAFLTEEASPLRQLLSGADAYPELPFILRAEKDHAQTGELYRHLSEHISSERARNRTLAVEGIIDLAIRKDGSWYVVDYKTDKLRKDESEEDFLQRLRGEYTPQITAYARVLERMNGKNSLSVKKAWLCSIPLNGKLVELDIAPKV